MDKIQVDCCIISNAKTPELKRVTERGIETLTQSEKDIQFNIFVVESNKDVNYDIYANTKTIYTDLPFGYNKYLNLALEHGNSPFVCLCNSDLTYEKYWASSIIEEMQKNPNLLSASPFCPQLYQAQYFYGSNVHYGYTVRLQLNGWAIFQQRKIYGKLKELNTEVNFWFSDNIYADQLIYHKIPHALIVNSVVNHHAESLGITGRSTLDQNKMNEFTTGQHEKYLRAKLAYIK